MAIYVDADACPVKDEVIRVAERHGLQVLMVSNSGLRPSRSPLVQQVMVAEGLDAADDWIAERAGKGDIAITADIPLAARCVKAGARVLGPTGKPFTDANIGTVLAVRNLMSDLRDQGEIRGGGRGFTKQDRSAFLQALEAAVRAIGREAATEVRSSSPLGDDE
jgi:uncharacterized protein YaiI (UPF0178 family)